MQKTITFDRISKDHAAYVDGNLIGYFRTRTEAEEACNAYIYEQLRRAA